MATSSTQIAQQFLDFVNASPSPFHAVAEASKLLESSGFSRLREREHWDLKPSGKYYVVRNQTSLISFVVGAKYKPGNGFNMIGAHTDSPCLKLKPKSGISKYGFLEVGVQTYGGGIWHTWFDRDLQVAGRVVVQVGETFEERLVRIDRPLLRIPTLAIHLQRDVNDAFKFNTETQLLPIIATEVKDKLMSREPPTSTGQPSESHHPVLFELLASELGCTVEQIKDLELCLAEHQPAGFGGAYNEFIFSPRLDNLLSSYCCIEALRSVASDEAAIEDETNILVAALFDNEEVGSESVNGAGSNILEHILKRIFLAFPSEPGDLFEVAVRNSFLVSADMAHARHPNYAEKHEALHGPMIHAGVVIKNNANQRYATSSVSGFFMRELARRNDIPIQEFVVRNDSMCGSTIGPMLSARGFRTVDVGAPQLSMHSAREMMGTDDVSHSLELFKAFYAQFTKLDGSVNIDC